MGIICVCQNQKSQSLLGDALWASLSATLKHLSIFRDGNPAPNLPESHVLLPGRHVRNEGNDFFFLPPPPLARPPLWFSPFLLISLPQHLVFEIWIRIFQLLGPTQDFSAVASFAFKAVE